MSDATFNFLLDMFKTVLPAVILPIVILAVTLRNTRKNKELDQKHEISKLKAAKDVEARFTVDEERRLHEKEVYASLLKILFEIQKLHIELSGNCVNYDCIDTAVSSFKESLTKYQTKISDNQIYLTAASTNLLYGFYKAIGELLIALKKVKDEGKFHLAIVCVHGYSQQLAIGILQLKFGFDPDIAERQSDEQLQKEYGNFISCCGMEPTMELVREYNDLLPVIDNWSYELNQEAVADS